ncbi:MAG: FkbM family methyltransferase [Rhizorhabdus sp.]|nr:FkbM family methyltransferase [Rhizorhabdus sp.]
MLTAISKRLGLQRVAGKRLKRLYRLVKPRGDVGHLPSATYVGNNRVLVGTQVGGRTFAFYVEADDRLLSPWFIVTGRFEVDLTNYFLRHLRPDSHCIDVGSNFGYYSCLMARNCPDGQVLGIEADRKIADLARDNLFINNLHGNAGIVCAAASDTREGLTLYRRISRSGNTSILNVSAAFTTHMDEPPAEPFTVESVRVDDLAERMQGRVDFIKIDVEGAEPLVLTGARETIRRNRDISIVMEWSPGQIEAAGFDVRGFAEEIAALGLRCFSLDRRKEYPIGNGMLATMPYQPGIVLRRKDADS